MIYRNCWQGFCHLWEMMKIWLKTNAFLFPCVERLKRFFKQENKSVHSMSLKSDYNIKQKSKETCISLLFWSLSCFVFIPFTAVKYFPPICYFLLNFLLDFFYSWVSTFCFAASGFGLKVVARDLALKPWFFKIFNIPTWLLFSPFYYSTCISFFLPQSLQSFVFCYFGGSWCLQLRKRFTHLQNSFTTTPHAVTGALRFGYFHSWHKKGNRITFLTLVIS